jgi:hypothetical protein
MLAPDPGTRTLCAPLVNPGPTFGDGDFAVNYEVAPGTYWAQGALPGDSCYWARLSDFSGEDASIIANSFTTGGARRRSRSRGQMSDSRPTAAGSGSRPGSPLDQRQGGSTGCETGFVAFGSSRNCAGAGNLARVSVVWLDRSAPHASERVAEKLRAED